MTTSGPLCPNCRTQGHTEWVCHGAVPVSICGGCNTVIDGLVFVPTRNPRAPKDDWERSDPEAAGAALERLRIVLEGSA